jgi:hypothetical protein
MRIFMVRTEWSRFFCVTTLTAGPSRSPTMVDSFLFPKPSPPHYTADQYPADTIWIPQTPTVAGPVPCFFFPYPR